MSLFRFKQFEIIQQDNAMKVGTDAMILGAFIQSKGKLKGLDIGAGTGVLSLMIAQQSPEISILGIELDPLSAEECGVNFRNSPFSNRLTIAQGNFLEIEINEKFDLIFSNPPYYQTTNLNHDARKAQARHDQSLPMSLFVKRAAEMMSSEADLWIIVPAEHAKNWEEACALNQLFMNHSISVFGKRGGEAKRVICAFSNVRKARSESKLIIRDEQNSYTKEYIELTNHFHFNEL